MELTILNLTANSLTIGGIASPTKEQDHIIVLPSLSTTTDLPHGPRPRLTIVPSDILDVNDKNWSICADARPIDITKGFANGRSWHSIPVSDHVPWRIYCNQTSRDHGKLVIFPHRDLSKFLSEVPDSVPLSSLLLPGTHDTMAFYGWPISQCQSLTTPLATQLRSGIRVLDIRLGVVNSRLIAYHGSYPQRTSFQEILSAIHDFITSPSSCRETIVMSLKQEDFPKTSDYDFSMLVRKEMFTGPGGRDMWFLENRVPNLGEVRGKVIMFSRFGSGDGWENGLEGLGMHPTNWPDSARTGFTWNCKDTLVRTHDWYRIPSFLSIPEKAVLSTHILLPPDGPPTPTLSLTYFSASSVPFALPPTVACGFGWPEFGLGVEGVNGRVGKWLLDILGNGLDGNGSEKQTGKQEPRLRGWVFMDFYTDPENAIVPLLVECNFRGRCTGEEGWV